MLGRGVPLRPLSPRERQVLVLVADGLTNAEIGERMQVATETVKTMVRHVLEKLDVESRAHAVGVGFRQGLLR